MEDFLCGGGGGGGSPAFDFGSSSVVLTSSELLLMIGMTAPLAASLFALTLTFEYSGWSVDASLLRGRKITYKQIEINVLFNNFMKSTSESHC